MVCTCAERGCRLCWENDAKDRAASIRENRKAKEEDYECVKLVDVTEEDAEDRVRWRRVICCGNPEWKKPKKKKKRREEEEEEGEKKKKK